MKIRNPKYEIRNGKPNTQCVIARNEAISFYHTDHHGCSSLAVTRFSLVSYFKVLVLLIFPLWAGCGVYSFTGASISPEVKSVSIDFFPSYAPLAPANMPQAFTEALRQLFISRSNLDLLNKGGDIRFEGYISAYQTKPVAIQGNETAAKNRLTISVNVNYTDTKDDSKSFEKSFTRFADFDATQNITDVEQSLIEEINDQLILDIFNEAVVNW
ncbi:MAG: hypothetical protein K9J17_05990 [Flavobacteriales bacterium]|nr:hypothetical protein [Flavobacteriales bacterium]